MDGVINCPTTKELSVGSYLFNLFIGIIAGLVVKFLPAYYFKPYQRGFYCDDESIRYPYHENTITARMLFTFLLVTPLIMIFLVEFYRSSFRKEYYCWKGYNINQIFVNFFKYYTYHLLLILMAYSSVKTMKFVAGRLRPNFIAVCRPIISGADFSRCKNHTFVKEYTCENPAEDEVMDARMSFYSGHASFISAFVIFFVIYLQCRIPRKNHIIVIRALLQTVLLCGGSYIAYSRILDAQHHWSDVVVGVIVGSVIGYFAAEHIALLKLNASGLKEHEAELAVMDYEIEGAEPDIKYKTSVVRVEPTELRIFD